MCLACHQTKQALRPDDLTTCESFTVKLLVLMMMMIYYCCYYGNDRVGVCWSLLKWIHPWLVEGKKKFFQSFWLLVTSITSHPPAHCRNHTTTHSLSISDFPSSAWEGFNEPGTALFRSLRRCLHLRVWDAVNAQKYCIHACGLNRHCLNVGWEGFCCLLLIIYMIFIVLYICIYIYIYPNAFICWC
jgi:hypothetical protein